MTQEEAMIVARVISRAEGNPWDLTSRLAERLPEIRWAELVRQAERERRDHLERTDYNFDTLDPLLI